MIQLLMKIFWIFLQRKNCTNFVISFENLEFNKNHGMYAYMISYTYLLN